MSSDTFMEVPDHVLSIFEPSPVLGGTVQNIFETPLILAGTGSDRGRPIVDRLAMNSVFSLTD